MDMGLLGISVWVLFLGGMFGLTTALVKFFGGGTPTEYGVLGIGGGFWLLSSGVVAFLRKKI